MFQQYIFFKELILFIAPFKEWFDDGTMELEWKEWNRILEDPERQQGWSEFIAGEREVRSA